MSRPDYSSQAKPSGWLARMMAVFIKEVRDHSRDRRAILLALIYPLLAPALVAGGLYMAGATLQSSKNKVVFDAAVVGAENSPMLVKHLESYDITVISVENVDAAKTLMLEHDIPVGLAIPDAARSSGEFTVQLLMNLNRVSNLRVSSRMERVINFLNSELAKEILADAGLKEDFAHPIKIENVSIAGDPNVATFFYNMMPPLIIFMIFFGGVHLSIDTTVGERERGSLEPLLLAPVERWVLLMAKSLAAIAFTALTTFMNLLAFFLMLGWAASTSDFLLPPPGALAFAGMLLLSIPLMAIAVALQMAIAVVTRSMKEAQIYLGLLPLVPALPGMVLIFKPVLPGTIQATVPVFGQMVLLARIAVGEPVEASHIIIAALSTMLAAAAIFWLAARWFRREKMFLLG